jgi:hypothetical protein
MEKDKYIRNVINAIVFVKLVKGSMKRFGKDTSTEKIIGIGYDQFIDWLDQGTYKHTEKGLHIDHCIPQSLGLNVDDLKI